MRMLIKQVDDEEVTFLMHAVSGRSSNTGKPCDPTSGARSDTTPSHVPTRQRRDGDDAAELGEVGPPAPAAAPAAVGAMDPGVVVFMTAWRLVQEVLWKKEVTWVCRRRQHSIELAIGGVLEKRLRRSGFQEGRPANSDCRALRLSRPDALFSANE